MFIVRKADFLCLLKQQPRVTFIMKKRMASEITALSCAEAALKVSLVKLRIIMMTIFVSVVLK